MKILLIDRVLLREGILHKQMLSLREEQIKITKATFKYLKSVSNRVCRTGKCIKHVSIKVLDKYKWS